MTVAELMKRLAEMTEDATVMIRHDLVGNEQEIVAVEQDEKRNAVVLREID